MHGYYYKAGKIWEDVKLWEATKDNPQEDINIESFLNQDNYWNIGSFKELANEMQLVLKADYSYPIILDEEYKLVDGAHRLVHAYIDGKTSIKGVIIKNNQFPEPDYDEVKECQNRQKFTANVENMAKICTTIEQSKKLIELGLNRETSDMFYWCGTTPRIGGYKAQDKDTDISAWSLSALLELMPKIDNLKPMIDLEGNSIYYSGNNTPCVEEKTILDAAFNMICLLLKEKKL